MDIVTFIFDTPLLLGFLLGSLLAVLCWYSGWRQIRELRKSLQTQMELTQRGHQSALDENAALTKRCAHLETSLAALSQRPGKAEMKTLYAYDRALHILYGRTPGFATAWESALAEAQQEMESQDKGLKPLLRKVFHPSLFSGEQHAAVPEQSESRKETLEETPPVSPTEP